MTLIISGNRFVPKIVNQVEITRNRKRIINVKMDEKEAEDRLVAAEAMSALASLAIVNPGQPSVPSVSTFPDNKTTSKRTPRQKTGKGKGKAKKIVDKIENRNNNSSGKFHTGAGSDLNQVRTNRISKSKNSTPAKSKSRAVSTEKIQAFSYLPQLDSQCIGTQTAGSSEDQQITTSTINLQLLSNVNLNLASLPSIPSIEALKLPANIDLSSFPNLNTVDLVLGGASLQRPTLESPQENPATTSGATQDEGDRNLPFKKRRYANSSEGAQENGGGNLPSLPSLSALPSLGLGSLPSLGLGLGGLPSLNLANLPSVKLPDAPSSSIKLEEKKPAPAPVPQVRTFKFDPALGSQLMSEVKVALTPDEDGDLPLHIAVVHENVPMIKKFIQLMKLARKSVDKFNKQKQTPLHLAVKLNLVDAIKLLLEADSDVNYVDQTGCTSLHLAVKHRLPHIIPLIYTNSKHGIDINTRDFEGFTPLHTAVSLNDEEMINILLDKGMDIDILDGKSGRTALFHAVEMEKKGIICQLLKKGANAEIQNYAGNTAIMAAHARNLRDISALLTCNTRDIPDVDVDSSSRSSSIEIQDKPPMLRVELNEARASDVTTTQVPIIQSQTENLQSYRSLPSNRVEEQSSDQPLDLHVEKKKMTTETKFLLEKNEKTDAKISLQNLASSTTAMIFAEHSTPVISISDNGTISTNQNTLHTNNHPLKAEEMQTDQKIQSLQDKLCYNAHVTRTVLTPVSRVSPPLTSVTSNTVTCLNSSVTSSMLMSSQRTPVVIPSGIQTFIKPELKARIAQNLFNRKLKAQRSEDKKD